MGSPGGRGHCTGPGEEDGPEPAGAADQAMAKADFHLVTFVQENFLNNHIHYVKLIGDLVTKLKRAGDGLGIHMVDNDIARMVTYTANKVATTTSNFQNLALDCVVV